MLYLQQMSKGIQNLEGPAVVYVISYDLQAPNDGPEDYERVIETIKTNFTWCHLQKSVWLVRSDLSASEIRDKIISSLRDGDELFVGRLEGNWASWGLGDRRNTWLHKSSF